MFIGKLLLEEKTMSDKPKTGDKPQDSAASQDSYAAAATGAGNSGADGGGEKPKSPKMGLERFLQKNPQQGGITALLRLKHKADVKTLPEWEALVKELLHKKVQ
jgi:hypothetical protein